MKRNFIIAWLTILCFLLLGNVHAWEVPSYLRLNAGARAWSSVLQGDLIQNDKTKVDLINNVGIDPNKLVWELFANFRVDNITCCGSAGPVCIARGTILSKKYAISRRVMTWISI